MVKVAKGLAWKPLSLKSRVLSHNLDLDGLIGVEELTDYCLDKSNKTVVIDAPKETPKIKDGGVKKKKRQKKDIQKFTEKKKKKKPKRLLSVKASVNNESGQNDENPGDQSTQEPTIKITNTLKTITEPVKEAPKLTPSELKRKRRKKKVAKIFMERKKKLKAKIPDNNEEIQEQKIKETLSHDIENHETDVDVVTANSPGKKQIKRKTKNKFKPNSELKAKIPGNNEEIKEDKIKETLSQDIKNHETEVDVVTANSPDKKHLKRKNRNKFKPNSETSESTNQSTEKEPDKDEKDSSTTDEPFSKKLKLKKKKKLTYLSSTKDPIAIDTSNNEEMFVEMSEWVKFNIPETIIKALHEKGFKTPTKIQSLVLPSALLARKDIVGAAETGSGKTLAFGIPILSGIVRKLENPAEEEENDSGLEEEEVLEDSPNNMTEFVKRKRNKLYALILAPTRELAIQVQNHLLEAGRYTPVKVACVVGGMSTEKQLRILNQCPHVLVATPGRLWEFIQLGHFHLTELYKINYLVIDETDRMIESGHFPELKNILDRVTMTETSQPRQTFVFSATLTLTLKNSLKKSTSSKSKKPSKSDPSIKRLQELLKISSPKIVDITDRVGMTQTLTESKILCSHEEKDAYLYYFILQHPGRTLVFCNSISSVKRLTQLLTLLQCAPLPLHASMNQRQRLKNLDRFREKGDSILLATDVAARGLDIPGIQHVIHYHVPRTSEVYVHRSGRTARASREGLTVLLVEEGEVEVFIRILQALDKRADLPAFPVDPSFLSLAGQRLQVAKDIEYLESRIKKNRPDNWLEKAAKDMDMIIDDENLIQPKESSRENALMTKTLAARRKELQALLGKRIQSYGCSVVGQSALEAVKHAVAEDKEEKKNALKKRNKHRRKFKSKKKTGVPV